MGIELLTCMDIIWILVRFCWITLFGQTNRSQTIRYLINHPFFMRPPRQPLRFAPHSTSPHFVPTGHASVCDACLRSSSRMQVVAGPMGVCRGMALREGRLPRQHHHANTDNISGRQRCLPPDTPPPPMSTPQDTHPFAMRVYGYHLVCRWCPAQWVFVGGRCFRVWGISVASAPWWWWRLSLCCW